MSDEARGVGRGAWGSDQAEGTPGEESAEVTSGVGEDTPRPTPHAPSPVSRRRALQVLGVVPLAGAMGMLPLQQQQPPPAPQKPVQPHTTPNQPAHDTTQPERNGSAPKSHFFTAKEMRTVRVLADDIIPADARGPSATAVGVPAFIDFHLSVPETDAEDRVQWRGGLRWLDRESRKRFGVPYAAAAAAQRHQILDDISFPHGVPAGTRVENLPSAMRYGMAFFADARDMVAAGYFSTPQGWKDLQYVGNTAVAEWRGCPAPALAKLGVSYQEYEASLAEHRRLRRTAATNE